MLSRFRDALESDTLFTALTKSRDSKSGYISVVLASLVKPTRWRPYRVHLSFAYHQGLAYTLCVRL